MTTRAMIDELFAANRMKIRAKPAQTNMPAADEPVFSCGVPSRAGIQRYTKDGLRILTADDIKAGSTRKLKIEWQFDCSCRF
jgi:hypothetical protein